MSRITKWQAKETGTMLEKWAEQVLTSLASNVDFKKAKTAAMDAAFKAAGLTSAVTTWRQQLKTLSRQEQAFRSASATFNACSSLHTQTVTPADVVRNALEDAKLSVHADTQRRLLRKLASTGQRDAYARAYEFTTVCDAAMRAVTLASLPGGDGVRQYVTDCHKLWKPYLKFACGEADLLKG